MSTITDLWTKDNRTFEGKTLPQILSFAGDGKLKDGNSTSIEFREFLDQVPSQLIGKFAEACLSEKIEDGGFALQDIINQVGTRLGFSIQHGLYRGKQSDIGYDGIWTSMEGHSLIIEVKTSDAYRINLDTIAEYRSKLIEKGTVSKNQSSILIVVGRQDTGDLEAQIRGSRHAWDIRLLSTDTLLKLLSLKEELNDTKTIQQINELLKPKEYTRIDKLIELIFLTSKDIQLEQSDEDFLLEQKSRTTNKSDTIAANFHLDCLLRIQMVLRTNFIKQSKIAYANKDKSIGLICVASKAHILGKDIKYWFAFRAHHQDYLRQFFTAFIAFGCGSSKNIFLLPYPVFEPLVKNMHTTEKDERIYWHVVIFERDKKYLLEQPKNKGSHFLDITKYKIKATPG